MHIRLYSVHRFPFGLMYMLSIVSWQRDFTVGETRVYHVEIIEHYRVKGPWGSPSAGVLPSQKNSELRYVALPQWLGEDSEGTNANLGTCT